MLATWPGRIFVCLSRIGTKAQHQRVLHMQLLADIHRERCVLIRVRGDALAIEHDVGLAIESEKAQSV